MSRPPPKIGHPTIGVPTVELAEIVSRYGDLVVRKLQGTAITGEPEDQLRAS